MVPIQSTKKSESKYSSNEMELLKLSWICCNFHPSGFLISTPKKKKLIDELRIWEWVKWQASSINMLIFLRWCSILQEVCVIRELGSCPAMADGIYLLQTSFVKILRGYKMSPELLWHGSSHQKWHMFLTDMNCMWQTRSGSHPKAENGNVPTPMMHFFLQPLHNR